MSAAAGGDGATTYKASVDAEEKAHAHSLSTDGGAASGAAALPYKAGAYPVRRPPNRGVTWPRCTRSARAARAGSCTAQPAAAPPPSPCADVDAGVKGAGSGGYNMLVVGAGLSGAVVARENALLGKKVLVIDKRDHTAGNCYDFIHSSGFRVAEYGPHFFHTNSARVQEYVQRFSEWTPWEHRVTARIQDAAAGVDVHVPVPANITTVNRLFGLSISNEAEMDAWLAKEQIPCAAPKDSRDVALSRVGQRLYDLLFKGYTRKQWDKWPEELDASVLARIPVRNNFDDRYFTDTFQVSVLNGGHRVAASRAPSRGGGRRGQAGAGCGWAEVPALQVLRNTLCSVARLSVGAGAPQARLHGIHQQHP